MKDLCVSLLGGATPRGLRSEMPADLMGLGVISRMVLVYIDDPEPGVHLVQHNHLRTKNDELVRALERISLIEGEATLTDEAEEYAAQEYDRFRDSPLYSLIDGYGSRRGNHILKLALILCMSETEDLIVQKRHVEGAKTLIENTEVYLPKMVELITGTSVGTIKEEIVAFLGRKPKASRSELVHFFSHKLKASELAEVLDTLIQARVIEATGDGRAVHFRLRPEAERRPTRNKAPLV